MPIGGVGRGAWGVGASRPQCLWNLKKVGNAAGTVAYIGNFDHISACNSYIYFIIYFIVNCFLSIVLILGW